MQKITVAAKKIMPNILLKQLMRIYYFFIHKNERLPSTPIYQRYLRGKKGIEIGGPSPSIFRSTLPIYSIISNLDSVNFSRTTKWEGEIKEGKTFFYYGKEPGTQYIAEASELNCIKTNTYDFLLSSNCLEHVANPIKALEEWIRVVKIDGYILLILPKKNDNFDNKRPITSFEHLLEDYKRNIAEDDLTHLNEVLELHDLSKDTNAGGFEKFKSTCMNNHNNREMHHHVFDLELIKKLFIYFNIQLIQVDENKSDYFALGKLINK